MMLSTRWSAGIVAAIVLFFVADTTGVGDDPVPCYDETPEQCSEYESDAASTACNTNECLKEHVRDANGAPVVENGFYVMTYDCPANKEEYVLQTGTIYSCDSTGEEGEFGGTAQETTIRCFKKRDCSASCETSSMTYPSPVNPQIRIAYCKSSSLALRLCDDHIACMHPSTRCQGECPNGDEGE